MFYHWLKNSTPLADGGNISGSTTATLSLRDVGTNDAAGYSVIVSNSLGSATGTTATLTVLEPPASVSVVAGTNVTFSVSASGTAPLTY